MADVDAFDEEEDVFGDVGGVVGDAFEVVGNEDEVKGGAGRVIAAVDAGQKLPVDGLFEVVDFVIGDENGLCHFFIAANEGIETAADHGLYEPRHSGQVDAGPGRRAFEVGGDSLGDVDDEIAHALEIAVDFDGGGQETEVAGDGLVERGEANGNLIDFDVELVDAIFDGPDFTRVGRPSSFFNSGDGGGDSGFNEATHFEQAALEVGEFGDEWPGGQGNSKIPPETREEKSFRVILRDLIFAEARGFSAGTIEEVEKTFYIETFGCQMNAHDSEKVTGTLLHEGYSQVATPEEANYIFYNTCSIRDKAEQKVFNRLQHFKKSGKDKVFAVIGCVAQQEGEKIFERAPHVSLVAGSASYTQLPEMLRQLEAGNRRVTGLSLDTELAFDTPYTHRDNPYKGWITIIEGCDKNCSYCVVPFTRGPERSRTSASVIEEATRLAGLGYSEIQLLGQNVNSYRDPSAAGWDFATLLDQVGRVPGIRRVRFTTSHPRDFVKPIVDAIDANPNLCNHVHLPVQSGSSKILAAMQRLYTREVYMERIEWMRRARRPIAITTDIIVGFPGETEADLEATLDLLEDVKYDNIFSFKYSRRPNTAALELGDQIPEEEKTRRIMIVQERQRAIQMRQNAELVGEFEELLVEGRYESTGQWVGRTTRNRNLTFVSPRTNLAGTYVDVRITRAGPSSLAGELV